MNRFLENFGRHKNTGLGMPMGKACFLGLKTPAMEAFERAVQAGNALPRSGLFSCGF